MRPVRKKSRLKEMLDARRARRARGGDQVINTSNTFTTELEPDDPLFQEIVQAQGPMPVGEAVVAEKFEPRNREERKVYRNLGMQGVLDLRDMQNKVREDRGALARGVAKGATSGAFEAVRMAPIAGEIIDGAEVLYAGKTGKDFYGDDASATELGAIMGAGLVIPNIIERPLKKLGKAAKKFFKFGKKADPKYGPGGFAEGLDDFEFNRILDDLPKGKSSSRNTKGRSRSTNVETPVASTNVEAQVRRDGIDILPETNNQPYGSYTYPRDGVEGIPVATNADTQYGVEFNRRFYSSPHIQGRLRSQYYPGGYDVEKAGSAADRLIIMDEARHKVMGELYRPGLQPGTNVAYQKEYDRRMAQELRDAGIPFREFQNIFGPQSYFGHTGPKFDGLAEGTELEFLFRRGERTSDMLMDPDMSKGVAGVYQFSADNIYGSNYGSEGSRRSLGAHEANHWANFRHFFGGGTTSSGMTKTQKNLANNYRSAVADATNKSSHEFITGSGHWSRVDENDGVKKSLAYYSDPPEILARTQELRLSMAEALQQPKYSKLSNKEKQAVLMGDLSSIGGEDGLQSLISEAKELGKGGTTTQLPSPRFWPILKGQGTVGYFDKERLQSIQKLLKAGFIFTGAAGAYGAMDNQGGQPSNSMYAGGVITMRKKKKGMSTIRK